jgi:hypothetical protein
MPSAEFQPGQEGHDIATQPGLPVALVSQRVVPYAHASALVPNSGQPVSAHSTRQQDSREQLSDQRHSSPGNSAHSRSTGSSSAPAG